jgi:hypothetical protein
MSPTFVMGDLHGQLEKTTGHLRTAGLIDAQGTWCGADATLCFLGDYCDRGPDGLGCIELVMRLQQQAPASGGQVLALLGNHEVLLLAARRFGMQLTNGLYEPFRQGWKRNGGVDSDLAGLTAQHEAWLSNLPAMARLGRRLLIHADARFYANLGWQPAEVNEALTTILHLHDALLWDSLLTAFTERLTFYEPDGADSTTAQIFLTSFDAEQLIHGHTPISYMSGKRASEVTAPLFYADTLCVNVDGGMYMGGPGFLYQLPDEPATAA